MNSVLRALDLLAEFRTSLAQLGEGRVRQDLLLGVRELQELMQKLQLRYGLLRQVLDLTNDLVCAKGLDGRYAMINPGGAALFGLTVEEILGADDRALLDPTAAQRIMAVDREVATSGMPQTREETLALSGHERKWIVTTTAWHDAAHAVRGVIAIAQDVTARQQIEREALLHAGRMGAMAAEIVVVEERLRRDLAAELHAGLGQDIALAKLKLSTLSAATDVELRPPLSGIEGLVEQADRSLRSITFRISPPSLHDLGLLAALEWLAENLGARYGVEILVTDADSPAVDDEVTRLLLFRAVRELLINSATHADVRSMTVQLGRDGERVVVTVADRGAGFDALDRQSHGYGLFGIREQLRTVGGTMDIASQPGAGTTVTLRALAHERAESRTTELPVR